MLYEILADYDRYDQVTLYFEKDEYLINKTFNPLVETVIINGNGSKFYTTEGFSIPFIHAHGEKRFIEISKNHNVALNDAMVTKFGGAILNQGTFKAENIYFKSIK